jgi:hypothetical protein
MLEDPVVYALVLDALRHPGPADPARVDAALCAKALLPAVGVTDAATGNAFLYGQAALAFASHSGVGAEPPLRPYAAG